MSKSIEPVYYTEIDDPGKGLNGIDICTFFNHILDQYCNISQTDINEKIARFDQAINPSLPLAV